MGVVLVLLAALGPTVDYLIGQSRVQMDLKSANHLSSAAPHHRQQPFRSCDWLTSCPDGIQRSSGVYSLLVPIDEQPDGIYTVLVHIKSTVVLG